MNKTIGWRFACVIFTAVLVLQACNPDAEWVRNQNVGNALGTTYSIIYLTSSEIDFQKEIDSVFQVVNQSMSTYLPDSDISKINAGDSTVIVDQMFKEVFDLSQRVHSATDGYFDPTVGVLVNAWGFGPGEQIALDSTRVDSLLEYVGFKKVGISAKGTITKRHPEIYFDFNAVAKGYAIDRLGKLLEQKGIANYLVEVGGEVLTRGENRISQKQWTVGIDDPQAEDVRRLMRVITLKDRALASSGNYRKFRIDPETGEKFVHTINPKTGYTKNSKVLATSVTATDCATADAYATAFMAMELQDSKMVLSQNTDLEGYIIYLDSLGTTQEFMTRGFEALLLP